MVRRRLTHIVILLGLCTFSVEALSFEWKDLWVSPEQRAARQRVDGENEALIESAPSEQWRGQGYYQKGEYDKAAEAFSQAREEASSSAESIGASYNEATSLIRKGEYDSAIEKFDELLQQDPEHKDALHNKSVAEKLKKLEEQPQDQNGQQGQQGQQNGEQQDGQQPGQQGEQQPGQPGGESQQGNPSANSQSGGENEDGPIDAEAGSAEAEEAAREALADAEAQNGNGDDQNRSSQSTEQSQLSEGDQATEQWLRQIDDDPAGLLRRKLELSHQQQYPGVNTSAKPW